MVGVTSCGPVTPTTTFGPTSAACRPTGPSLAALPGRFVAFSAPRPTTVGSVVEGLEHVYDAPGRAVFEFGGATLRLTAFNGYTPGSLMVLFTDGTSGTTTYPTDRALGLGPVDEHGNVTLDFNRAVNLPCAFTDFATCPLPPAENRLPIAVEAARSPTSAGPINPAYRSS